MVYFLIYFYGIVFILTTIVIIDMIRSIINSSHFGDDKNGGHGPVMPPINSCTNKVYPKRFGAILGELKKDDDVIKNFNNDQTDGLKLIYSDITESSSGVSMKIITDLSEHYPGINTGTA